MRNNTKKRTGGRKIRKVRKTSKARKTTKRIYGGQDINSIIKALDSLDNIYKKCRDKTDVAINVVVNSGNDDMNFKINRTQLLKDIVTNEFKPLETLIIKIRTRLKEGIFMRDDFKFLQEQLFELYKDMLDPERFPSNKYQYSIATAYLEDIRENYKNALVQMGNITEQILIESEPK